MPEIVNGTGNSRTRKRKAVVSAEAGHTAAPGPDEILLLENQILESRRHYNSIASLLEYVGTEGAGDVKDQMSIIAAVALCRVFCRLMALGKLSKSGEASKEENLIVRWLRERLREFKNSLISALGSQKSDWSETAVTLLMQLIKEEAVQLKLSEDAIWRTGTFSVLLGKLMEAMTCDDSRTCFINKYLVIHDDIRYYTFTRLIEFASSDISAASIDIIVLILAAVEKVPENREDIKEFFVTPPTKSKHSLYSPTAHKRKAQEAWMAVLSHGLSKAQRRTVLDLMALRIAPWFLEIALLMDFLTDSFNVGGSTSLLALSGLFYLIQQRNLDYPQFYPKLYSMLDSDILHSKHRSRFFRLLNTFLASTHLPAALVASFIKRLSRLTLHAPPSGIVAVVPWIYNLLMNHPACTFMIHRKLQNGEEFLAPYVATWGDPFRMEESDPIKTGALESSLWEIQTLQSHYHPNVATIAKIISDQFTKQAYNLEDFLDHSYGSMLDAEFSKEIKKPPEIEYEIPKKIFFKHDADSGSQDSLLVQLWDFS